MAFDILAFFGILALVSLVVAIVIAWLVYRWYKKLPKPTKYLLLAILLVGGAFLLGFGIGELMWFLAAVLFIRDQLGRMG